MEEILRFIKKLIPRGIFKALQPVYHYLLALLGAVVYGFPTKKLYVIGITGTKGKTTTAELMNSILEEAGYTTALAGTLRFKIGNNSRPNLYKMTMPGRFALQKFFKEAVKRGATHAVIEVTSEGSRLFRHRFLDLNALIFTNIEPEHIESHGSYEKYVAAKLDIAKQLLRSGTPRPIFVGNKDAKEIEKFIALRIPDTRLYSIKDAEPYTLSKDKSTFTWRDATLETRLVGEFNILNCVGALTLAEAIGIEKETALQAIKKFKGVPGRMEEIKKGQDFTVIVDYAHTPESLRAVYKAFQNSKKICVLSGTGGGRDKWKRPMMGSIASEYCDSIILTDEDPYDEDPRAIVEDIQKGIANPNVEIEMDRRAAIAKAIKRAKVGDVVLITGKGTDPYIMGPQGLKTPWSDSRIAEEELERLGFRK